MFTLFISTTALGLCVWAMYQCRTNRREINRESERLKQLRQALIAHQAAPNLHGPRPWDFERELRRPASNEPFPPATSSYGAS